MLSFDMPISSDEIEKIKELKDEKVFLLTGFHEDRVVVKADTVEKNQLKQANFGMKSVDRRARVKALTDGELVELKMFADTSVFQLELLEATNLHPKDVDHPLRRLKGSPGWDVGYTFFKMEAHTLIDMAQAYQLAHPAGKNKPVDLRLITDFATSLKATGGLEKLGEIIAVDLFNAYEDRFFPGGGQDYRKWKAIVNLGNVFVTADPNQNNSLVPTGLDFLNKATPTWQTQVTDQWPGHVLSNVQKRRQFANDVIDDLEYIFAPIPATKRTLRKPKPALGYHDKAVQRLIDGMREGVKKIIIRVRLKGDKLGSLSQVDAGLLERYNIIQQDRTDI